MRKVKVLLILALVIVVILVVAGSPAVNGFGQAPKASVAKEGEEIEKLPAIDTPDKLKELVVKAYENQNRNNGVLEEGLTKDISLAAGAAKRAESSVEAGLGADSLAYSGTNVQVAGVDEADIVKTDGKYIYQVISKQVVVTEAVPADQMKVVSRISFDEQGFRPQEPYLHGHYLVIIGTREITPDSARKSVARDVVSKALVYDVTDKSFPAKAREVELDGYYLSSRLIGSALYLVVNKEVQYTWFQNPNEEVPTPFYRDSVRAGQEVRIGCENIRYFPELVEPNYLVIGAVDLNKPDQEMQVATYLGGGQSVYASPDNLYVAYTTYGPLTVKEAEPAPEPKSALETTPPALRRFFDIKPNVEPDKAISSDQSSVEPRPQQVQQEQRQPGTDTNQSVQDVAPLMPQTGKTMIYKFKLNQGQTSYVANGQVPGAVLNQFSMDEHNGFFRVATTSGISPSVDQTNNVYILNEKLSLVGKLEGVAPGERIYSVRFMGERGYVVTFKKVDPLFVLDLQEPTAPKILGELKIPGYSDYLHPYDENHIIGFGKDAIEVGTTAYYQGMKIALFDVSDVEQPRELFKEVIGDRGTDSELLRNHKALLFDKDRGLLAFPVMVAEIKNKNVSTAGTVPYGEPVFQGAYVYHLDLTNGFQLKAKITHMAKLQMQGRSMYNRPQQWVDRIMYIGDNLYTMSKAMIKANSIIDAFRETGSLVISHK